MRSSFASVKQPQHYNLILRKSVSEIYHKMELEKKRARSQKQTYKGPTIRYHSLTMPLIEEYQAENDINVETSDNGHTER